MAQIRTDFMPIVGISAAQVLYKPKKHQCKSGKNKGKRNCPVCMEIKKHAEILLSPWLGILIQLVEISFVPVSSAVYNDTKSSC